jgi:hypothetical protein
LAAAQRGRPFAAVGDAVGGDVLRGGERELFASCQARIDVVLEGSAGMRVVERTIEAFVLSSEEKASLWLWAWSRRYPLIDDPCDGVMLDWGPRDLTCPRPVAATTSGVLVHD